MPTEPFKTPSQAPICVHLVPWNLLHAISEEFEDINKLTLQDHGERQ
jgi:hypothetical protein